MSYEEKAVLARAYAKEAVRKARGNREPSKPDKSGEIFFDILPILILLYGIIPLIMEIILF